jgi:hypothetical protein
MLTEEEVRVLKAEWGNALLEEDSLEVIPSPKDMLHDPEAMKRFFGSTMGVEDYVHKDFKTLLTDLGGAPGSRTLPFLMEVAPVQGWQSLTLQHKLPRQQREIQKRATWAIAQSTVRETLPGVVPLDPPNITDEFSEVDILPLMADPRPSTLRSQLEVERLDEEEIEALLRDWIPLYPHWHQLVGVHAILKHFLKTCSTRPGFLIADDVGIGKTAQVIMTICILADLVDRDIKNQPWPPIHGMFPKRVALQL